MEKEQFSKWVKKYLEYRIKSMSRKIIPKAVLLRQDDLIHGNGEVSL